MEKPKRVLLIITGSVASYKALELIRELRRMKMEVSTILTKGGKQFVTPLAIAALSEMPVYEDLFSLKDETEMGHIRLSREADLVLVVPASADIIAKMANGQADDLATTTLLASDKPVMVVPAMNHKMWENPATKRNIETLRKDGVKVLGPIEGDMACGEYGFGRMIEVQEIVAEVRKFFTRTKQFSGLKVLVTAGTTREAIDPVRFISNHSSGRQGYAVAEVFAEMGADVTLISGYADVEEPAGVSMVRVKTAREMGEAVIDNLPADIGIFAAAVSDWHVMEPAAQKLKKASGVESMSLELTKTQDIIGTVGNNPLLRPKLLIGFAAETDNLESNALAKLSSKNCDYVLLNDVSGGKVFGEADNEIQVFGKGSHEEWPRLSKREVAEKLSQLVARSLNKEMSASSDQDELITT